MCFVFLSAISLFSFVHLLVILFCLFEYFLKKIRCFGFFRPGIVLCTYFLRLFQWQAQNDVIGNDHFWDILATFFYEEGSGDILSIFLQSMGHTLRVVGQSFPCNSSLSPSSGTKNKIFSLPQKFLPHKQCCYHQHLHVVKIPRRGTIYCKLHVATFTVMANKSIWTRLLLAAHMRTEVWGNCAGSKAKMDASVILQCIVCAVWQPV